MTLTCPIKCIIVQESGAICDNNLFIRIHMHEMFVKKKKACNLNIYKGKDTEKTLCGQSRHLFMEVVTISSAESLLMALIPVS